MPFLVWADERSDILPLLMGLADEEEAAHFEAISELEKIGGPQVSEIFEAYRLGNLYLWEGQVVMSDGIHQDENYVKHIKPIDVLSKEYMRDPDYMVPVKSVQTISAGRNERKVLSSAQMLVQLTLSDKKTLLSAIRRASNDERALDAVPRLEWLVENSRNKQVRFSAAETLGLIRLQLSADPSDQLKALNMLGEVRSLRAYPLLMEMKKEPLEPEMEEAVDSALERIESYQNRVKVFDIFKSSISTGSILILMALGLAITFGMMGIINMAHGEMMMIGAYTTYCIQLLFNHSTEHPVPIFYFIALPLSFIASAAVGGLIEWSVVRKLYKKPIESLLATYGISLLLIQIIRLIFGDNRATNSPQWLQGALNLSQGMSIPANRIFILVISALCVAAVWAVFKFTKLGLHMRATMQNRDMAAAMGINTRRVDSFTFMLGSGIAGVAGYALTTIGGITPDMGKNYIVDSFLVVVTGGVGSLAGVVSSGMGIGFINKLLEGTFFGAVWSKILVLALVILFIQFRPSGLFAPKGRLADD